MKKASIRKMMGRAAAVVLAAASMAVLPAGDILPALEVRADEAVPGCVRSVYTNEWIPAEQSTVRPIAVMMPTDKTAQPSYGISNADILYEIMEEGEISRQMAVISNWTSLSKIGNIRSCRAYYIPEATEWDPILIHFGGVFYMKDRITAADINNISGTNQYGVGGGAPGAGAFFRTSDRKAPHNAYINASGIINACTDLGYSLNIREGFYNAKHFTFAAGVNTLEQYGPAAATANAIDLSHVFTYTKSSFVYNPEDGLYYKSIHGKPQTDGLNGQQLKFANVIVQNTKWCRLDDKGYLYFQNIDNTEDGYYFTKGKCIMSHGRRRETTRRPYIMMTLAMRSSSMRVKHT